MGIWLWRVTGLYTQSFTAPQHVSEDISMCDTIYHRPDSCHGYPSPKIPIFLPAFISIRQALVSLTRWLTVTKLKAHIHYRQKAHSVQPSSSSPCLHLLNTPHRAHWLGFEERACDASEREKVDSLLKICLFSHWKEKSSGRRALQTQPSLATKDPNLEGTWEPMELESIPSNPTLGIGPGLVWESEWRLTLCGISVRAL